VAVPTATPPRNNAFMILPWRRETGAERFYFGSRKRSGCVAR